MKTEIHSQGDRFQKSMLLNLDRYNPLGITIVQIIVLLFVGGPSLVANNLQEQGSVDAKHTIREEQDLRIELGHDTFLELKRVPTGNFTFGRPKDESGHVDNEGFPKEILVNHPFWIGKYEVTRRQMLVVFGFFNPRRLDPKTDLNRPVNFVNWIEADKFCSILTEQERTAGRLKEGFGYRQRSNGNMPVVPEKINLLVLETDGTLTRLWQISMVLTLSGNLITDRLLENLSRLDSMKQTRGVSMTCTVMFGNGVLIVSQRVH